MLQQISEESMARLKQLAAEWETHRVSALNTYRQLRDSARNVKVNFFAVVSYKTEVFRMTPQKSWKNAEK